MLYLLGALIAVAYFAGARVAGSKIMWGKKADAIAPLWV